MKKNKDWLKNLYPGYFALTMATGIISLALTLHNFYILAEGLFVLTLISWLILTFLYTWRLYTFPKTVLENLIAPKTTFIFFTFVAATNISGMLLYQHGFKTIACIAWVLAFIYWSALMYFSFASLCFAKKEREVNVVHGGWLILIVGTQSLVLLGSKIASELGDYAGYMMLEIHMLWALGMIFYAILVTLLCYRIFFMNMHANDFSPLMWVIMGAAAISTNAGSHLILTDPIIPLLEHLKPIVQMLSIMLWTWATWWIPLLTLIGIWKHFYCKTPLIYEPLQWSMIFPLGMYTVATYNLALSIEFKPLFYFSSSMLWVAFISWCIVITALVYSLFNRKKKVKKMIY